MKLSKLTSATLPEIDNLLTKGLAPVEIQIALLEDEDYAKPMILWESLFGATSPLAKLGCAGKYPAETQPVLQIRFGRPSIHVSANIAAWVFANPGQTSFLVIDTSLIHKNHTSISSHGPDVESMIIDLADTLA